MKRMIRTSTDDLSDKLDESIDMLDDNFDYILSGLELLSRSGEYATSQDIASRLSDNLSSFIEEIANNIKGG